MAVRGEGEGRRGVVLTAWHVLAELRQDGTWTGRAAGAATAVWQSGYSSTGKVLASDRLNDVAVFIVRPPKGSRPIPVGNENPDIGESVEIIGWQFKSWKSQSCGYLNFSDGSDTSLTTTPSIATSGDSGGGMIYDDKLVGVLSAHSIPRAHDRGMALRPIRRLLTGCAPWALKPRRQAPRRPQQPSRPVNPPIVIKPQKPQNDRVASLERKLQEQSEKIAELIKRLEASEDREPVAQGVDIDVLVAQAVAILDARQPAAGVTKPPRKRKMTLRDTIRVKGLVPRGE